MLGSSCAFFREGKRLAESGVASVVPKSGSRHCCKESILEPRESLALLALYGHCSVVVTPKLPGRLRVGIGTATPLLIRDGHRADAATKKAHCQHSAPCILAERKGLEPSASGVTGRRYNRLNYRSGWWAVQDLNLWPPPCKGGAQPTELTAHDSRTLTRYVRQRQAASNREETRDRNALPHPDRGGRGRRGLPPAHPCWRYGHAPGAAIRSLAGWRPRPYAGPRAFSVCNALRFPPYGLAFRGKSAVFPLGFCRAPLCRRLTFCLFQRHIALNPTIRREKREKATSLSLADGPKPPAGAKKKRSVGSVL